MLKRNWAKRNFILENNTQRFNTSLLDKLPKNQMTSQQQNTNNNNKKMVKEVILLLP